MRKRRTYHDIDDCLSCFIGRILENGVDGQSPMEPFFWSAHAVKNEDQFDGVCERADCRLEGERMFRVQCGSEKVRFPWRTLLFPFE